MAETAYQGAGIGIERMNEMIEIMRTEQMTITQISLRLNICDRSVKKYLSKLMELKKLTVHQCMPDMRFKYYMAAHDATPIPVPVQKHKRRRPLKEVKLKTGPKPKRDKEQWNAGLNTVRIVAAKQIGIARDPLVEMLFGRAA